MIPSNLQVVKVQPLSCARWYTLCGKRYQLAQANEKEQQNRNRLPIPEPLVMLQVLIVRSTDSGRVRTIN